MSRPARAVTAPAQPRERPILFSAPMVRAILAGTKAQTRRLVKPSKALRINQDGTIWRIVGRSWMQVLPEALARSCPHGQAGDLLWVKETWAAVFDCPLLPCECEEGGEQPHRRLVYRATDERGISGYCRSFEDDRDAVWNPSLFMSRRASRITLELTGVKVERLQDISEEDAIAEGVGEMDGLLDEVALIRRAVAMKEPVEESRVWFSLLWNSINGEKPGASWEDSPWVWVLEFKRVTP